MTSAWYRVCAGGPETVEEVRGALCAAGVALVAADRARPIGPGVLLVEVVTDEVLAAVREACFDGDGRIIVLAIEALDNQHHWELLGAGAAEVMAWRQVPEAAAVIAARLRRWAEVDRTLASPLVRDNLVGESAAWRRTLRQVIETARFSQSNALIIGESGTGKELTARLIHTLDLGRSQRPLVVLDCTTVTPELAGSEFFGHERGAFTGASEPREGAFALADGGTLFLDEVGELPPALQAQLLRVIQEGVYKRVGGNRWHSTRFRLVCATNRALEAEVTRGAFRGDLYHRLANCIFKLPPLRERPEDILALARRFLAEQRADGAPPALQAPVEEYLQKRAYPGNVRELRQLVSRIATRHVGQGPITVGDLPDDERPGAGRPAHDWRGAELDLAIGRALCQGAGLKDISQHAADVAIRIAVANENGNLQRAARRLGVTDRALQLRRAGR